MNLPRLALRHHQFALVTTLLLVTLGTLSLLTMPRSEDPQFDFPGSVITAVYPGANPLDMEQLVVDPLEQALNELDDLKFIKTDIEDGLAVLQVEFLYGTDPDDSFDDVVNALAAVRDRLPAGVQRLDIEQMSPTDVRILQVALSSDSQPYASLKRAAERLEDRFEQVPGVKQAYVRAYPEPQLQVQFDPQRMRELGVSLERLIGALESEAVNIPGGHLNSGQRRFTVRTSGDYPDLATLANTVLQANATQLVRVRDVAQVRFGDGDPTYLARYQSKPALFVTVAQREGGNILQLIAALKAELAAFSATLPAGIDAAIVVDQSESVAHRVDGFFASLLQGLLVVGSLTLLVLGLRASLVIVLAIPFSILIALGWLDLAGFGLQQMSIVGLVIALGLLVDNAIVVTENVERRIRQGEPRRQAAARGAQQVAWAVTSGTLTTVLAFVPILLLPSGSGSFMRSMPVTVILTLFASLLIALLLVPLLASKVLPQAAPTRQATLSLRGVEWLAARPYRGLLARSLAHPWWVLLLAISALSASLALFPHVGVSLFPKAEKPMLLLELELPEGSRFDHTYALARRIEQSVSADPIVRSVATNVGKGNPRIYYNESPKRQRPNYAQLLLQLNTRELAAVETYVETLRARYADFPQAHIRVKEFQQGPPTEAPIAIRLIGNDIRQLLERSRQVEAIMRASAGTVNVDNPIARYKVDLRVSIDRDQAALLQVPVVRIDQAVRTTLAGQPVGLFRDHDGEDYPIVVRRQGRGEPTLQDLQQLTVLSDNGALVPLKQLARLELVSEIPRLQHHNLQRMARVTADVAVGYHTEAVTNAIIEQLEQLTWSTELRYQVGGEQESRKESFAGMLQATLIALLGVFAVLVLQFRSFLQPVIIFGAIPFALTGAILALWLTGYTFSFTAFIGLTSLVGIVVNNAIILVDSANQLRLSGQTRPQAISQAAQTRLPPILLTTFTTIGGLLPLTLTGSTLWSPMGWAIIGGLVCSTLLTLLVVPVLYCLLTPATAPTRTSGEAPSHAVPQV